MSPTSSNIKLTLTLGALSICLLVGSAAPVSGLPVVGQSEGQQQQQQQQQQAALGDDTQVLPATTSVRPEVPAETSSGPFSDATRLSSPNGELPEVVTSTTGQIQDNNETSDNNMRSQATRGSSTISDILHEPRNFFLDDEDLEQAMWRLVESRTGSTTTTTTGRPTVEPMIVRPMADVISQTLAGLPESFRAARGQLYFRGENVYLGDAEYDLLLDSLFQQSIDESNVKEPATVSDDETEDVKRLKTIIDKLIESSQKYAKAKKASPKIAQVDEDESNECCICLDKFETPHSISLPCKHEFHPACFGDLILKNYRSCPICRNSFKLKDAVVNEKDDSLK